MIFLCACEGNGDGIQCYPTRVKRTFAGTSATTITADYRYAGNLVDRIIWSNSQTHYYYYDEQQRISEIARVYVERLQKSLLKFSYENDRIERIDEYTITLDYVTQEDTDTVYSGYRELEYDAGRVVAEHYYVVKEDQKNAAFDQTYRHDFEYDAAGNLVSYTVTDILQDQIVESWSMEYDTGSNPYSAIDLYFNKESNVNNILRRTDNISGESFTHQVIYNTNAYPQQVTIRNEAFQGNIVEVITYDYECR